MWTKTTSMSYSLADGVLADAILIFSHLPLPPTNTRKVRGPRKILQKLVIEKPFTSKLKNKMYGWLNASLKSMERRDSFNYLKSDVKMHVSA